MPNELEPWRGIIVGAGGRDVAGNPQFEKAVAGYPIYSVRAFFVTQHLKVTTPLIQGFPRPVPGVIDPLRGVPCIGGRNSGSTTISFYLQHRSDDVIVSVVDSE